MVVAGGRLKRLEVMWSQIRALPYLIVECEMARGVVQAGIVRIQWLPKLKNSNEQCPRVRWRGLVRSVHSRI